MARKFNFSAGPAALPLEALQKAQAEFLEFKDTGASVMEISHRSKAYQAVIDSAEARIRRLLKLTDDYAVLFLQGGASLQFCMVPMNLMNGGTADYIDTGVWSGKALKEAKLFGTVNLPFSGKDEKYVRIPDAKSLKFTPGAKYVHLTSNNTIYGTQWREFPKTEAPLVADMSSDILCRPFDMKQFGLIYAGAQKNLGPSGVTLVVIRKDLAERAAATVPTMLKYSTHIEEKSMFNTPSTFGIYILDLCMEWLEKQGGAEGIAVKNEEKAKRLYGAIDASGFYRSPVEKNSRSIMNVVWRLPSEELEAKFVKDAAAAGMAELKGHRSAGGIRASLYNATGIEAVDALVAFMKDFEKKNG